MKTTLAIMFAAIALSAPAVNHAHAAAGCTIHDNGGNTLEYIFADKSHTDNADGTSVDTVWRWPPARTDTTLFPLLGSSRSRGGRSDGANGTN